MRKYSLIGKSAHSFYFMFFDIRFLKTLLIIFYREVKIEQSRDSSNPIEAMETCTRLATASDEVSILKPEKTREGEGEGYSGGEDSDSNQNEPTGIKIPMERRPYYESTEKYRKTLRLSSEQIVRISCFHESNFVKFAENIKKIIKSSNPCIGESRFNGRR